MFARRHEGTSLKAYAVDPGAAKTELQRSATYVDATHFSRLARICLTPRWLW